MRSNAIMLIPQWIDRFLELLYDGGRSLPVIMITCPDLISPGELQRQLLGNAIVCFCDDPNTIFLLNDRLPPSCSVPLDSIRTYLPFTRDERRQPVHPIIALPDIQRLGSQEIYAAFRQAYCENLRASERSAFITVDTCRTVQMERKQAALCQRLVRADADLRGMKKDLSASRIAANPFRISWTCSAKSARIPAWRNTNHFSMNAWKKRIARNICCKAS